MMALEEKSGDYKSYLLIMNESTFHGNVGSGLCHFVSTFAKSFTGFGQMLFCKLTLSSSWNDVK